MSDRRRNSPRVARTHARVAVRPQAPAVGICAQAALQAGAADAPALLPVELDLLSALLPVLLSDDFEVDSALLVVEPDELLDRPFLPPDEA